MEGKFELLESHINVFLGDIERLGDLNDVLDHDTLVMLGHAISKLEYVTTIMDGEHVSPDVSRSNR